jgi:hypothetical protein
MTPDPLVEGLAHQTSKMPEPELAISYPGCSRYNTHIIGMTPDPLVEGLAHQTSKMPEPELAISYLSKIISEKMSKGWSLPWALYPELRPISVTPLDRPSVQEIGHQCSAGDRAQNIS